MSASPAFNTATPPSGSDPNKLIAFGNYDAKRWEKAAATNKKFMDTFGGKYSLFNDINALWWEKNEYNSEVIWDRQVVGVIMGSNYEQYGGPVWIDGVYYTWGNYCPTQELVDQFAMANGKPLQKQVPAMILRILTKTVKSAFTTSLYTTVRLTSRTGWLKRTRSSQVSIS
jgi:hypothetical protein